MTSTDATNTTSQPNGADKQSTETKSIKLSTAQGATFVSTAAGYLFGHIINRDLESSKVCTPSTVPWWVIIIVALVALAFMPVTGQPRDLARFLPEFLTYQIKPPKFALVPTALQSALLGAAVSETLNHYCPPPLTSFWGWDVTELFIGAAVIVLLVFVSGPCGRLCGRVGAWWRQRK